MATWWAVARTPPAHGVQLDEQREEVSARPAGSPHDITAGGVTSRMPIAAAAR